jgi:hypothetical protein
VQSKKAPITKVSGVHKKDLALTFLLSARVQAGCLKTAPAFSDCLSKKLPPLYNPHSQAFLQKVAASRQRKLNASMFINFMCRLNSGLLSRNKGVNNFV